MMSKDYIDGNGRVTVAIGIVSGSLGCAKYPGIYSRLTNYIDWVRRRINNDHDKLNQAQL